MKKAVTLSALFVVACGNGGAFIEGTTTTSDQLGNLDPSPFGMCSHLAHTRYYDMFAEAGIAWQRIDIDWYRIETAQGEYDWREVDRVLDHAERLGLSSMASIGYSPRWASGSRGRLPTYSANMSGSTFRSLRMWCTDTDWSNDRP